MVLIVGGIVNCGLDCCSEHLKVSLFTSCRMHDRRVGSQGSFIHRCASDITKSLAVSVLLCIGTPVA